MAVVAVVRRKLSRRQRRRRRGLLARSDLNLAAGRRVVIAAPAGEEAGELVEVAWRRQFPCPPLLVLSPERWTRRVPGAVLLLLRRSERRRRDGGGRRTQSVLHVHHMLLLLPLMVMMRLMMVLLMVVGVVAALREVDVAHVVPVVLNDVVCTIVAVVVDHSRRRLDVEAVAAGSRRRGVQTGRHLLYDGLCIFDGHPVPVEDGHVEQEVAAVALRRVRDVPDGQAARARRKLSCRAGFITVD